MFVKTLLLLLNVGDFQEIEVLPVRDGEPSYVVIGKAKVVRGFISCIPHQVWWQCGWWGTIFVILECCWVRSKFANSPVISYRNGILAPCNFPFLINRISHGPKSQRGSTRLWGCQDIYCRKIFSQNFTQLAYFVAIRWGIPHLQSPKASCSWTLWHLPRGKTQFLSLSWKISERHPFLTQTHFSKGFIIQKAILTSFSAKKLISCVLRPDFEKLEGACDSAQKSGSGLWKMQRITINFRWKSVLGLKTMK